MASLPKNMTIRCLKLGDAEKEQASKLVRFGPIYGEDSEANRKAKDSAWKHTLQKSGVDEEETERSYLASIRAIEKEAMESYDSSDAAGKKIKQGLDFRWTMVRDGCFFLQIALHILGAGDFLDYPAQNPYFGKKSEPTSWIPAIFFVGNQIPCVVIRALMEQPFFRKVIDSRKWVCPTDDLAKLVLYLAVVEPELKKPSPNLFSKMMTTFRGKPVGAREPPSNILHILHSFILGPGDNNDPNYSEMQEFLFHDLEAGSGDSIIKIPSAGELYKSGIKLRRSEPGISNIRFRNFGYSAYLYLPPLIMDAQTEHILSTLAGYERNLRESDREVTAYIRFMRDLVRTYKDFKILEKRGIVQVKPKEERLKGSMVRMLDNLVATHNSGFTLNFQQTQHKIKDYGGPPWRLISGILGILTIVQTIFTILSYLVPLGS